MRVTNALLILVGSGLVLVGCEGMGMFGPSGIDMLEERIGGIADAQGGLSSFVESGNTAMQEQLDKMTASLETINFRTEEDRKGAMGMIATVQATFDEFKGSVAEHATSVDEKVGKLWDDAKELFRGMFAIADEFEVAVVGGDTTRWPGRVSASPP